MLAFIDEIVIPFLNGLYGAVGYLGVAASRWPSSRRWSRCRRSSSSRTRASWCRTRPRSSRSPAGPGTSGSWCVAATIGNTLGSLVAYAIGAYGGRPFLERYGKYLLIRPHEIELANSFFERHGSATVFIGRLLPIVRTFISFPAGVARMHTRQVHPLLDRSAPSSGRSLLVWAGTVLGANWEDIRRMLQPFDLAIAVAVVALILGFIWWRIGMPGRPGRPGPRPAESETD